MSVSYKQQLLSALVDYFSLPDDDTLHLQHTNEAGINKKYTFAIYKNEKCKSNNVSKKFKQLTPKPVIVDDIVDAVPNNDVKPDDDELLTKRGKKKVVFTEPEPEPKPEPKPEQVYCYVIVYFDDILQFLVVGNANIQTFHPAVTNGVGQSYSTLIYMTERDYMNIITESNIKEFRLKVTGKDGNTVELPGVWEYKYDDNTVKSGGIRIRRPPREKRYMSSRKIVTRKKTKSKRRKTRKYRHVALEN